MSNNSNLQLRRSTLDFKTREEVINYIDIKAGEGITILPFEPVLFFYGAEDMKNTIMAIGLPDGKTIDGKKYFVIDTAYLQSKIDDASSQENEILEKINQEIIDRENGDKALESKLSEEASLREETDTKLEEKSNINTNDIQSVISACGLIYNEKQSEDRVSYAPDSHDEIIRDTKNLAEAIDKISKFVKNVSQKLSVSVKSSDTVDMTVSEDEKSGGSVISADVRIANVEGLSKKAFDNNIIGKTTDGIYAAASIEASTTNPNMLVFKTSGYVNGQFKVDANETEFPLGKYSGDNGKQTGVNVSVDEDKNVISAQLNLASDNANLLKLEDGEYIVDGHAKNIVYKDTTVAKSLNTHASRLDDIETVLDDIKSISIDGADTSTLSLGVQKSAKGDYTVSGDVKLSGDNSIVVVNDGLSANVNANYKVGTSTLEISVGNNVKQIDLSSLAVSVLKSAEYDAQTEELVLTFAVGDGEKTIRVPVGKLIHDIDVDDTETVDLTLTSVAGGPNRISADLKIDKVHSDNILTVGTNGAYVSKTPITEAVAEETKARQDDVSELKSLIKDVTEIANSNKESIADERNRATLAEANNASNIINEQNRAILAETTNANSILSEETRAKNVENAIETKLNEQNEKINTVSTLADTTQKALDTEVNRAKMAETTNANAIEAEISRAKGVETVNANAIKANTEAILTKADANDVFTKNEVTTKLGDYAKTTDVNASLATKLNIVEAENIYATKDALQKVKDEYATVESVNKVETNLSGRIDANTNSIDNFGLTYNAATSTLTYTNKNGNSVEYKLYNGTLVKEGYFDDKTNSVVLVVVNGEIESKITIPVSELLSELSDKIEANAANIASVKDDITKLSKDWVVVSSPSVELSKNTSGEKDSLTASVKIASSNKQAIQSSENGLYVSNDLEDYTVVFGATGTISGQDAISKLLEGAKDVSNLEEKVNTNSDNIAALKKDVNTLKTSVSEMENTVAQYSDSITSLNKDVTAIKTQIDSFETRMTSIENSVKEMNTSIETIKAFLETLVDGGTYEKETNF